MCSDQTVNRREEDEAISLIADLPFPVSSDVKEITNFLTQDKYQVVFSTYQSSPLIAKAQKNSEVPHFDLVIADEAHRCAGESDSPFGTVLDDRLIKGKRRLFGTATPRVYKTGLKKAAEELGVEIVDMSDEKRFGKRFHTLTFGEAIERDLLTDYRVLIIGVDNERIKEWIENRHLVSIDSGLATDARTLAGEVGLLKAIKDWNLHRLISFHGRVKRAREFSEDISQVGEWLDGTHRFSHDLWADYVSGEMPTIARRQKLKRLKNVDNDEIGVLSNARCLSEGVDVPALDGVAFIDPRSSEIDIIQSVGRAIRLSKNKTIGTIMIPVFIEQTDDAKKALDSSDFKPIWNVLKALKSHDERLSDELDQLRIELGAKKGRSVGGGDLTKIVFDLPTTVTEDFAESLRAYLVAQTTESWMFWYGLLERFVEEHGHCRVPQSYVEGTFNLGTWVLWQRRHKDTMSPERKRRLDAIGFVWDAIEYAWEEGLAALTVFKKREGHCGVPDRYIEGTFRLGQWVGVQRANKETMRPERKQRLNAIGFVWDPYGSGWEEGFAALEKFHAREGHSRVPALYVEGTFPLGRWVNKQRTNRENMLAERRQRLDAIGFAWDVIGDAWDEGFTALRKFQAREGNCLVPRPHLEGTFKLGQWVGVQRANKDAMSAERRQRLDAVGFIWDVIGDAWEEGFAALKKFQAREGNCLVPRAHVEGRFKLGTWVGNQRTKRNLMSAEHRQRLDGIGFVWDVIGDAWEQGFAALKNFQAREGNCLVPHLHLEGTYRLGAWVGNQRGDRDKMPAERKQRLNAVGFVWDARDAVWEERFAALKKFQAREGNCLVPALHVEGKYRLGQWVNTQRNTKETMPPERKQRLNAVGFVWDARDAVWEEHFAALKKFQAREGNCLVPPGHVEGNYKLGSWVYSQRDNEQTMPPERKQRLDAIGFIWEPHQKAWEEGFAALRKFHTREGHCLVPRPHVEGTFKLGMWVHHQRGNRDAMSTERRKRLDAIGFIWRGK